MDPSAFTIPASFDDLTPPWLEAALVEGGLDADLEVAEVVVEPLGPSVGFLGDLARLTVVYERGSGPSSLIVKLPTTDPGGRQVGAMLGAWAREVAFYQEVAPASPGAQVPHCYYAAGDPDIGGLGGHWVVLLEDCQSDPIDTRQGATAAQARAAVDALAGFHANWWASFLF